MEIENCNIKIDKDGIWYYCGAHMFRKEILRIFFENLKVDKCGKYLIELGDECCYLEVEDTVFVVEAVNKINHPEFKHECIYIILTDDSSEELDLNSLVIGRDNVLYCKVKDGKFLCRFSRKSYYQLADFIEEEKKENGNNYFINLNGKKLYINCEL
jgi:hypothetical protein